MTDTRDVTQWLVKKELEALVEASAEVNAKPATPSDSDPDPDLEPDSASDPEASSSKFISLPRQALAW